MPIFALKEEELRRGCGSFVVYNEERLMFRSGTGEGGLACNSDRDGVVFLNVRDVGDYVVDKGIAKRVMDVSCPGCAGCSPWKARFDQKGKLVD